jgi:hypothetical protein
LLKALPVSLPFWILGTQGFDRRYNHDLVFDGTGLLSHPFFLALDPPKDPPKTLAYAHRQGFYSPDSYVDEGIKLLRITDLKDFGEIDTEACPRVSDSQQLIPFFLEKGDFLFARTGGAGTFGLIEEVEEPLV